MVLVVVVVVVTVTVAVVIGGVGVHCISQLVRMHVKRYLSLQFIVVCAVDLLFILLLQCVFFFLLIFDSHLMCVVRQAFANLLDRFK